jgi:prepilin-type N-terminal cleavage/methylation domain-containing protein
MFLAGSKRFLKVVVVKVCKSDKWRVTSDEASASCARRVSCHLPLVTRHLPAFTLIELLVVIAILGILAGLAVPALKNLGKSDATVSAARQLLDDVGRARQLAMANRTTVYMVFVPTNFWNTTWLASLTTAQQSVVTNLVDKQLSGYTFVAHGAVGDQPGNHQWHYLAPWQSLPDGTFIAAQKFAPLTTLTIPQWQSDYNSSPIPAFTNFFVPFPTESSTTVLMPCIAFDYSGRLVSEVDASGNYHNADIPLARGSVAYGYDGTTKTPQLTPVTASGVTEVPPGNSTGVAYNVVHIDALTGRAVLQFFKIQ